MRTLLLIPTEFEKANLLQATENQRATSSWRTSLQVCGMGLMAASLGATRALSSEKWDRCLLVGLGGSFDTTVLSLGEVLAGTSFHLLEAAVQQQDGILNMDQAGLASMNERPRVITPTWRLDWDNKPPVHHGAMLSVFAASGDESIAQTRRQDMEHPLLEDMETFAVAWAAQKMRVPFACLRGVCNAVGDRDMTHWQIPLAMAQLGKVLNEVLS